MELPLGVYFVLVVAALTSACGGGGHDSEATLLIDEQRTMQEGTLLSYDLAPGTYTAEVTATYTGVAVSWVGGTDAGCMASVELTAYKSTCTLVVAGQLVLSNPTVFRIGIAEDMTIRITKN